MNDDLYDEEYDYDEEEEDDAGIQFIGAPYFITVHQLVEVMEYDTAVLECAITNIDPSVTVSIINMKILLFSLQDTKI